MLMAAAMAACAAAEAVVMEPPCRALRCFVGLAEVPGAARVGLREIFDLAIFETFGGDAGGAGENVGGMDGGGAATSGWGCNRGGWRAGVRRNGEGAKVPTTGG